MLKTVLGIILVVGAAAMVPFGLIALSRSRPSPARPIHPILDMDKQPKFRSQRQNPMFADDRAMRPLVPGVVAQGDLAVQNEVLNGPVFARPVEGNGEPIMPDSPQAFDRLTQGIESQKDDKMAFVTQIPVPVTMDLMQRGRERFNIFCAVCHGAGGYGDGMVARRAAEMQASGADTAAGWVAPTSYHTDEIRNRPAGHLYNTITNGIRTMPAYSRQVQVLDRWAIVAYVKALQRSQDAKAEDVPETQREKYQ